MTFRKYSLNLQHFSKLALLGIGASLFFIPSVLANTQDRVSSKTENQILLAQAQACPRAEVVRTYETSGYRISICRGQDGSLFYRGVAKRGGNQINVSDVVEEDGTYVATNGNTIYRINSSRLQVVQNGRVVLNQRVIKQS